MNIAKKINYDIYNLHAPHKEIGKRVIEARSLSFPTRKSFSEFSGIPEVSLFFWEHGKRKITKNSLKKIIHHLKRANIFCSPEWLMQGQGIPPMLREDTQKIEKHFQEETEDFVVDPTIKDKIEMAAFFSNNPDILTYQIPYNYYKPCFHENDFLIARKISSDQFQEEWEGYYLYEIKPDRFVPAYIEKNQEGTFTVMTLEKNILKRFIGKDLKLEVVFPIINVYRDYGKNSFKTPGQR